LQFGVIDALGFFFSPRPVRIYTFVSEAGAHAPAVMRRWEETLNYFAAGKPGREKTAGNGADTRPIETSTARSSFESVSTLGPGIVITGNIICEGSTQIFGSVTGDIQAAQIVIGDGARVEGNLTALEVAINGTFKGTIRANNVRLKGNAVVDGEIFSKSLTVEENVQFEGMSRKLDKSLDQPAITQTATVKAAVNGTKTAAAAATAAAAG
jgi:cytoskeletal protein CcmA (bactofilin family)